MDYTDIFNGILALLWLVFACYLLKNKKSISINNFGFMLVISVLCPYILYYDIMDESIIPDNFRYEVLCYRVLILVTFFNIVRRGEAMNRKLTKMSKNSSNLLKPNK